MTPLRNDCGNERTNTMSGEKTGLRQVNLQLPADLHKRLRIRAIEEERSMGEIVALLVEKYLAGKVEIPRKTE